MSSDIIHILDSKGIEQLETIEFTSEKHGINFIKRLELLQEKGFEIKYITNDLVEILLEVQPDEENLQRLKKTNWDDFILVFKEKESNERKKRIYKNFMNFIKAEVGIIKSEKPLVDHTLVDQKREADEANIDLSLFKPKEHFNIEKDLEEKRKKFDVDVLFDYTEPGRKLTVQDFTLYFNRRLQYFTELLSGRINLDNVMRVQQLRNFFDTNEEVSIIGLVSEIQQTKKGHYMLTIEDKSGQIKCFVNKDKPELVEKVELLCLDEGIGIRGNIGDNIIWTEEIVIPSPPMDAELKSTSEEHYVACISDIHFGAREFVDEAFQKFVDFMNGRTSNEQLNELAKKVKYVILAGDIIDGIGIYPNQGKDSRILSTELQYHEAARWLSQIPKDKCLIIIPGNHDSDRLSEPQPKLPYSKAYALYNMENAILLSNPSQVKLFADEENEGLTYYIYHGGSIFYYADKIQSLRDKGGAKVPEEVIKFLLEKRHIAPSHGSTLYVPDSQNDPLVIKSMPDYFIVGHTHKLSLANYKGCTIVSCGCWVEMSEYQEKMGMYPDVGKCTLLNSKTRKPRIINFYKERYKQEQ